MTHTTIIWSLTCTEKKRMEAIKASSKAENEEDKTEAHIDKENQGRPRDPTINKQR